MNGYVFCRYIFIVMQYIIVQNKNNFFQSVLSLLTTVKSNKKTVESVYNRGENME